MSGDRKVLVYHYRGNGSPVVKNGLDEITQKELTDILKDNENLQSSTKAIQPGEKTFDIYQKDLYTHSQKESFKSKFNYYENLASIKLPKDLVNAGYSNLTILSHKRGDK